MVNKRVGSFWDASENALTRSEINLSYPKYNEQNSLEDEIEKMLYKETIFASSSLEEQPSLKTVDTRVNSTG